LESVILLAAIGQKQPLDDVRFAASYSGETTFNAVYRIHRAAYSTDRDQLA
jgi:hypothetical protein